MTTIRSVLIERLTKKIVRLKRAQCYLRNRGLKDEKLERQVNRLESIRDRLRKKDSTGNQEFNSDPSTIP